VIEVAGQSHVFRPVHLLSRLALLLACPSAFGINDFLHFRMTAVWDIHIDARTQLLRDTVVEAFLTAFSQSLWVLNRPGI